MRCFTVTALAAVVSGAVFDRRAASSSTTIPQYFQTSPLLYAGPTPTGQAAFLAQTNPAPFPSVSYVPPQPLETQEPISGKPADANVFELMGQLSHYFPNPIGFGVDEYPLPAGANITQLHMVSRHGARYPTSEPKVVGKLQNNSFHATGNLAFLNDWTYKLGEQILVPVGKLELFQSGVLHQYMYGHLYPNNGSKIIARTTTEYRMVESAEHFLSGFFGLDWGRNATLELIIEQDYFNNSLAGYDVCNNSNVAQYTLGDNATDTWVGIYLKDAAARLNKNIKFTNSAINLTAEEAYDMQSLCAYETVALGYSAFCSLFTYEEWQGYEYSVDINFAGNDGFQASTGRAVGIGYVQEFRARLQHHLLATDGGPANITLDNMTSTFPLDQSLYFDFSHDTNIMSMLTAFGFTQFSALLPATHMVQNRSLIVSHLTPFGARFDIEVIKTPRPLSGSRKNGTSYTDGPPTTYIHFILNQRTLPLGTSYPQCGRRDDGWCEAQTFLNATANAFELSMFDYACFGDYPGYSYGELNNGNPRDKKASNGS